MADFSQLTERQKEIYRFIRTHIGIHNYGPTVRDIGDEFGIKSPNGVMCHLKALEKKGLILRKGRSARAITLADHRPPAAGLPLCGKVAAGAPILAIEQSQDTLEVDDLFAGPERFVLEVQGDSMIDDHIQDGDYVVIQKQETASNGDTIVALIDNEATLKHYYRDKDQVRLEPANRTMQPILVDPSHDLKIVGKLVGVLRKC